MATRTLKGYRFVTDDLKSRYGNVRWQIGEWNKCEGRLWLCTNGFHASENPLDSLSYAYGTRWFECEARGGILRDRDKFCASEMRLVREIPRRVLQRFALDCAWRTVRIFEAEYPADKRLRKALKTVRAYLKSPNSENLAKVLIAERDCGHDHPALLAAVHAIRAATYLDMAEIAANTLDAVHWARIYIGAKGRTSPAESKWQRRHLQHLIRKERNGN